MATPPQVEKIDTLLEEMDMTVDDLAVEFGPEARNLETLSGWTASEVIEWLQQAKRGHAGPSS